jgi:phosphoribosyl-dephospho-CoA transferase
VPALAALETLAAQLEARAIPWGPCGSVGFELASGVPTAGPASDLDVTMTAPEPLPRPVAVALLAAFTHLPVRVDVQLEVPHGAVALAEYAAARGPLVLRTNDGARLVSDPWAALASAAA